MTIRDFPSSDIDCDELVDNPNEGADLPFQGGHLLLVLPESDSVEVPMPIGSPFEQSERELEFIEGDNPEE